MNQKGIITRDARLSIRIPRALKETIERYASKARQTVADAMIPVLEEAMQRATRKDDKRQVKSR